MQAVRIGLLGLGVVGGGTLKVLLRNAEEISRRAGRSIVVTCASARRLDRARDLLANIPGAQGVELLADPMDVVRRDDVDVVVELMGGSGGCALACVTEALDLGKPVVTANKALLALHGNALFSLAARKGTMLAFEAAVAGGIPVIKAIREGLTANRIAWVAGIINGTTNFILSEMRARGESFATVLAEAQRLGYAEADPTFDIEGVDAAHKLTLLASIAFGVPVQFDRAHIEGISQLQAVDIAWAEQLGYRIKLLGITRRRADGIELRVHPTLVPVGSLLANVEGAMNAVMVKGDAVGVTLYYGKGAGEEPTASAVVADVVDVVRLQTADPEHRVPHLAFLPEYLSDLPILPVSETHAAYYLRLAVDDRPGVLADITRILADEGISIGSMIQREAGEGADGTDIVFLTHEAVESAVNRAMQRIESLPAVRSKIVRLRRESLQ